MHDSQTRRSAIVLVTQVATRLLGLGALLVAAAPPMAGQEPGNDSRAGVLVERNIRIPMSDDVTLAADVIRPEQAEPVETDPPAGVETAADPTAAPGAEQPAAEEVPAPPPKPATAEADESQKPVIEEPTAETPAAVEPVKLTLEMSG